MADLLKRPKLIRPLKAVVSCGNGTAGAFAPRVLAELGVTVCRSTASSTTPSRRTIRTPKTCHAQRHARGRT